MGPRSRRGAEGGGHALTCAPGRRGVGKMPTSALPRQRDGVPAAEEGLEPGIRTVPGGRCPRSWRDGGPATPAGRIAHSETRASSPSGRTGQVPAGGGVPTILRGSGAHELEVLDCRRPGKGGGPVRVSSARGRGSGSGKRGPPRLSECAAVDPETEPRSKHNRFPPWPGADAWCPTLPVLVGSPAACVGPKGGGAAARTAGGGRRPVPKSFLEEVYHVAQSRSVPEVLVAIEEDNPRGRPMFCGNPTTFVAGSFSVAGLVP